MNLSEKMVAVNSFIAHKLSDCSVKRSVKNDFLCISICKNDKKIIDVNINHDGGFTTIDCFSTEHSLAAVDLGEKLKCAIYTNGRIIEDYTSPFTTPDTTETVKPTKKEKIDPKNFEEDERFLQVMDRVKEKILAEIPIMQQEIVDFLGKDQLPETVELLKRSVYATSTTVSAMTVKFLMEGINEVMGQNLVKK
jgi:hypothetical protein